MWENNEFTLHHMRKLTANEYFRLMGISDEYYAKAAAVNPEAQLYKQAGNAIVVDCLKALFKANFGDPRKIRMLELFSGIGTPAIALLSLGFEIESQAVEIDAKAVKTYNAFFGTDNVPLDIKDFKDIEPNLDLLVQGSPCTDFSPMGQGEGGERGSGTASSLIWHVVDLVAVLPLEQRPKVILGENVKGILFKKHRATYEGYVNTLTGLGYRSFTCIMNAKDYGIPQSRTRVFTYSVLDPDFKFTEPTKVPMKPLTELLLSEVPESKYYSDDFMSERADKGRTDWVILDLNEKGELVVASERQRGTPPKAEPAPDGAAVESDDTPSVCVLEAALTFTRDEVIAAIAKGGRGA